MQLVLADHHCKILSPRHPVDFARLDAKLHEVKSCSFKHLQS